MSRVKLHLIIPSILISAVIIIFLGYHYYDSHSLYTPLNTYNPLTFKNNQNLQQNEGPIKDNTLLTPINNLVQDELLQQRINHDLNNHCPIFTFFNDQKVRKLSLEEQKFHKLMLKKWVLLYNSLGFNVHILHYNDAIENPKMPKFATKGILMNKENQIKENYLKLLAWEQGGLRSKYKGSVYSDYTIFPIIKQEFMINELKFQCDSFESFTMFEDYDFNLMMSDHASITAILESLEVGTRTFQIYETDKYNDLFADYSIKTFQKLFNSNHLKRVVENIPIILDQHLKNNRIINRFNSINIVDPISISDHYFSRTLIQMLKSLIKCEETLYQPPTINYLKRFDKEIVPKLPDRITSDSEIDYQVNVEVTIEELLKQQNYQSGKCSRDLDVTVSNELSLGDALLNLVSIPHPASVISALHLNDKHVITNDDLLETRDQADFLTETFLLKASQTFDDLVELVKNKETNILFFNAETLSMESLQNQLSILLGVDILPNPNNFGLEFTDSSKSLDEIISKEFLLSQGEFTRKLDNVKNLIKNYGSPMPYVINQRQSIDKLKELRENLKKKKEKEDYLPERIRQGQHFESRHDPIIEISENWNPRDSAIWHLIKNLRYIDEVEYKYLNSFN